MIKSFVHDQFIAITNEEAFIQDFLVILKRKLQNSNITWKHVFWLLVADMRSPTNDSADAIATTCMNIVNEVYSLIIIIIASDMLTCWNNINRGESRWTWSEHFTST